MLTHFVVSPLPTKTTLLGFDGDPVKSRRGRTRGGLWETY